MHGDVSERDEEAGDAGILLLMNIREALRSCT